MMILIYGIMLFRENSVNMGYTTTTIHVKKHFWHPLLKIRMTGYIQLFLCPNQKCWLTHSTYKITSFLDFHPFLQGFQSVNTYIHDLLLDIANPTYYKKLIAPYHNIPSIITSNLSVIGFLKSSGCSEHPYACRAKLKFDHFKLEIQYIYKIFGTIHKKFLTTIDHIDYHPSQQYVYNKTRVKRSDLYESHGYYHSPTRELTSSENDFLDVFLEALYKVNPSLHKSISRMKRQDVFTFLLGWGIYANAKSISKIKEKHTYPAKPE